MANATSGPAPLAVLFTDASSGDGTTARAREFGDGGTSTEKDPVHVYAAAGNNSVNLTVTTATGSDGEVKAGLITATRPVAVVQGGTGVPTDTNGDGKYDDVNGKGRKDFADIVWLFNPLCSFLPGRAAITRPGEHGKSISADPSARAMNQHLCNTAGSGRPSW